MTLMAVSFEVQSEYLLIDRYAATIILVYEALTQFQIENGNVFMSKIVY